MAPDIQELILIVVVSGALLLTAPSILGAFADDAPTGEFGEANDSAVLDGTNFVRISDGEGRDPTVRDSRGLAAKLSGNNSSIEATVGDLSDDTTWTACTWARVQNTSATMAALTADDEVAIGYNGTAGEWRLYHYDVESRETYILADEATTPGSLTHICAIRDGNSLSLTVNATQQANATISDGNGQPDEPLGWSNWNGTLEETRTFDDALTSTEVSQLVNSPIDPLPTANRTARLMYDENGFESFVYVFYQPTNAERFGVTYVEGFAGSVLDERTGILDSGDYRWRDGGPQIAATSGGALAEAPVAYVSYERRDPTAADELTDGLEETFSVIGAVFGVLALIAIVTVLRRL